MFKKKMGIYCPWEVELADLRLYAFGLRIPLPAGNKFRSFPQTYEVLL